MSWLEQHSDLENKNLLYFFVGIWVAWEPTAREMTTSLPTRFLHRYVSIYGSTPQCCGSGMILFESVSGSYFSVSVGSYMNVFY
jgi:hypothetical protein